MNRKLKLISLLTILSLTSFSSEINSIEDFYPSKVEKIVSGDKRSKDSINTNFVYNEDSLYTIYCRVNYTTMIMLNPDEKMLFITAGDTARWNYQKTESGSTEGNRQVIYIKPLVLGVNTNIIINTDKRIYSIKVISHKEMFNPVVRWRYSSNDFINKLMKEEEKQEEMTLIDPSLLDYSYTINTKKYDFSPTTIFDDGKKTYIVMKENLQELPSFYIKDGDKLLLVNYRTKGNYLIVDRTFKEGTLQIGKNRVIIKKKAK